MPDTGEHLPAAFLKLEAVQKRREAETKRVLKAMDELHESFDPRGWTSQKGQALLDLMFNKLTQLVADNTDLQGQVADLSLRLSLVGRARPLSQGEQKRRHAAKLARLQPVVDARKANPTATQQELAKLLGLSDSAVSNNLCEAKLEGML